MPPNEKDDPMPKHSKTKSLDDLAETLLKFTYTELVELGDALTRHKGARCETAQDFAALLHAWAGSR